MTPRIPLSASLALCPLVASTGCQALYDLIDEETATGAAVEASLPECPSLTKQLLEALGEWFPLPADFQAQCKGHVREVTTGVTLGASTDGSGDWNNLGGNGELMAEAGLCLLADLGRFGAGGFPAAQTGIGPFSVRQNLGQTKFEPQDRHWEGYQTINVCAPLVDCFEVQRQAITADVVVSPAIGPFLAGSYAIEDSYALRFTSEPNEMHFTTSIGPFIVPSPVGPINIAPTFTYDSYLSTVDAPFPHPSARNAFLETAPFVLQNLNGRTGTAAIVGVNPDNDVVRGGWVSQLGFGQRDGRPDTPLWAPDWAPDFDAEGLAATVRPDFDYGQYLVAPTFDGTAVPEWQPRTDEEADPVARILLEADIGYDLEAIIPQELLSWPLEVEEASLTLSPRAEAWFAAQTNFVVREGDPLSDEFGEISMTQVFIQPTVAAAGEANISVDLDLVISASAGPFPGPKVSIHKSYEVPFVGINGDEQSSGTLAWAEARTVPGTNELSQVAAWSGYSDDADFLDECFEDDPYGGSVPPPVRAPGEDGVFNVMICNLCAWEIGDGGGPGQGHWLAEFGDPAWECSSVTNGCTDLCRFDPATGAWLELVESAADNPDLCDDAVIE